MGLVRLSFLCFGGTSLTSSTKKATGVSLLRLRCEKLFRTIFRSLFRFMDLGYFPTKADEL